MDGLSVGYVYDPKPVLKIRTKIAYAGYLPNILRQYFLV